MIKALKNHNKLIICLCTILLLSVILIFLICETITAKSDGAEIGTTIGSAVGNVVGSAKAVLNADDIIEKGKDEGVLAKDTEIDEIIQRVKTSGRLIILSSDVSLYNSHKVGEKDGEKDGGKYKAIYIMNGKVNFTVDLSLVDISYNDELKTLVVTIPEPTADLNIDSNTVKKIADAEKFSLVTDAEKGSKAYTNSMNEIKKNVKKNLENYDSLATIARNEAELRIKDLVGNLSFVDKVIVKFAGGDNNVKSK